jgi:polyisoprenoid-binding protein YceI
VIRNTLATAFAVAAIGAAHADTAIYRADPSHTLVTFEVKHFISTTRGRFDKKEGSISLDLEARTGKVEVTIETSSIDTGIAALDAYLKSEHFFNSAEAPTATFSGDRFSFERDKVTAVSGTLTMLGKTLPVTLKATGFDCYQSPFFKREVCGGDFETTIARSQWGMSYGVGFGIGDTIRLLIQIEAVKQ